MNSEQFKQWCQAFALTSLVPLYSRQPLIMGILNVTPDSFSDGGRFINPDAAYRQAMVLIEQGADIIDIGGESSQPGAKKVACDEELQRVIPVLEQIRRSSDICISIDTCKPAVMRAAVHSGASFINDIFALSAPDAVSTVAELGVPVCLMHMQGTPQSMQDNPCYEDGMMHEINAFFQQRITACVEAGINRAHIILDPGFGFGKTVQHNLQMIENFADFHQHHRPLLIGASRKSTLGKILNKPVTERLGAGIAIALLTALQGASIIRTHDINETKQALQILDATKLVN